MSRRAILQIGTEKTGTTTLQQFLAANRSVLAARGYVYPRFCGATNQTGLAALALDDARTDTIRELFAAAADADIGRLRARMRAAARVELADVRTAIFCNEHCHSRLTTAAEVAALHAFLREHFDDIQVCVYLRRQDQVALSLYSTYLKSGGREARILPRTNSQDPYFNYAASLALWAAEFGGANLHVRLFDREALIGGSIVDDFMATWDLGGLDGCTPVRNHNESIQPAAQEYLRHVNAHLGRIASLPPEAVGGPLASALAAHFSGRGTRPARAAAMRFYDLFRASNEVVRRTYFPDRALLFSEDFSSYPEDEDSRAFSLADFAAIAATLTLAGTTETRRLESEIAIRDARLHWVRDAPDAALAALDRAITWRPKFAEAQRTKAEFLARLDRLDAAVTAARRATELNPQAQEYWHFLGVLLRRTEALEAAAEAQRRSLALKPDHAPSRHELDLVEARIARSLRPPQARSA